MALRLPAVGLFRGLALGRHDDAAAAAEPGDLIEVLGGERLAREDDLAGHISKAGEAERGVKAVRVERSVVHAGIVAEKYPTARKSVGTKSRRPPIGGRKRI